MDRMIAASLVLAAAVSACSTTTDSETPYMSSNLSESSVKYLAPQPIVLDPTRKIVEQDCSKPVDVEHGNLRCK